ncbi:MAG: thiol-disulfide oxidoreductase DCC family protein [Planctomycetota bacterium]
MKHSWTGGQYSGWRALFGLGLAIEGLRGIDSGIGRLAWLVLGLAVAAGVRDRLAALLLVLVAIAEGWPGAWAVAPMLLLHAATRGSPYGTFDARGRADPGGNWILPRWNLALRRLLVLVAAVACLARGQVEIGWLLGVALALAACDPGWIPPARAAGPARVFYDGHCGLCHRFVRLILAEDLTGRSIRFAPLDSEAAREAFDERERASLPDSVVVKTAEGATLFRSRGTLHILARLGGLWRLTAGLLRVVPRPVLDLGYNFVARVRHRIFARAKTACPIVPRHLAARFDA